MARRLRNRAASTTPAAKKSSSLCSDRQRAHATHGAALAQIDLNTIYRPRWSQLTERQLEYIVAVVGHLENDGSAPSNLVATTYGVDKRSAGQTRKALIEHPQLLYFDATNLLRFARPGLDQWVAQRMGRNRAADRTGR